MENTTEQKQLMAINNVTEEVSLAIVKDSTPLKLNVSAQISNYLIEIAKIKINRTDQIKNQLVEMLVESIEIIGLLNPIVVTPDFKLVAGRHRLEAYKILGLKEIPASIITLDEIQQELATIDENLIRKVLTKLEEAEQLSERKKLYEIFYPEIRRGVAGALARHRGATDILSFAADTAIKTGQSERNVNRKIAIYDNLHPEVRNLIRDTSVANRFTELLSLSRYDTDTQISFAELIKARKAKNIAEASRLINALSVFANTDKGKFRKSVKLAEKALKQLIEGGIIASVVNISEKQAACYLGDSLKQRLMTDLESLQNLQKRVQEAIKIFEDGVSRIETKTYVVSVKSQNLGLAE